MTTRAIFWLCQIIGWSLLLAFDFSLKSAANLLNQEQATAVGFLYSTAFAFSFVLRWLYKKKLELGSWMAIVFWGAACSLTAAAATVILLFLEIALAKNFILYVNIPLSFGLFLSNWIWLSFVFISWSTLYLLITRQRENVNLSRKQELLKYDLKEVQLLSLQQQLNPHFIFNCINNIRALILEEPQKARDMLSHMADMLRYNLVGNNKTFESIENELRSVRDFVALSSIQFEGRLRFDESIDENCLAINIPKMTLQMLLENAIKHGISNSLEGGEVRLAVKMRDSMAIISVLNDGVLDFANKTKGLGIGIKNVEKQLLMSYGDAASITLSQKGKFVEARVAIPLDRGRP